MPSIAALALLSVVMSAGAANAAQDEGCLVAISAQAKDSWFDSTAFDAVPCGSAHLTPAFRYDRFGGAPRLSRPVAAGEVVRSVVSAGAIRPGTPLHLTVAAGTIRIQRDVWAVQAARTGQALFVRTRDGDVFAVPFTSVSPR
jgi:hypothetical protein